MTASASARRFCLECGAPLAAGQARCWLCARKMTGEESENPYASPRPIGNHASLQFSLASLFLVITLVAVCLGVSLLAPGLGVLLSVMALPALIRTVIDVAQHKRGGTALGVIGKAWSFVVSLIVVVAAALAAGVAFFTVCSMGIGVGQARGPG